MALNIYKEKLISIFNKSKEPLTAQEIIESLQALGLTPNKTTIYRSLRSLIDDGKIKSILIDSNTTYYEKNDTHHHHFICNKCKVIKDFTPDPSIEKKLMRTFDECLILNHSLELFGLCQKCKKNTKS
jgi:Fe2+ or Zn2+ uptake regulation protein